MDKRKRFYVALALYAVIGVAIWMTVDNVPIPVRGPDWLGSVHITMRQLTLVVLGIFVLRTVLHWRAEQIQIERESKESSS